MQLFSQDTTIFLKKKEKKKCPQKVEKPPSKVAQNSSNPLFFLTVGCPNGPNRRIPVPKCGLQTNCIQNWGYWICNDMKNPEYFQFKLQLVSRKIHPFPSRNIKQKYVDECSHVACEKQLLRIFMLCLYQFFPCNTQCYLEYKNTKVHFLSKCA